MIFVMLALSHGLTFEKRVARSAVLDETVLELQECRTSYRGRLLEGDATICFILSYFIVDLCYQI